MKKLGIIGGAGPLASALLYETIVKECYRQRKAVPEMVLLNYPFTRGLTIEDGEKHQILLKAELQTAIASLTLHGAEIGLLACNTLHRYLKQISVLPLPFLPLPQTVIQEALHQGHRRLLILGSQNTCAYDLYKHPLITTVYPETEEQALIDRVIDQILEGIVSAEDSFIFSQIIVQKRGIDGVVLGCTELPVLHHHFPIRSPYPIYDSIKIPAHVIARGLL